jgi:hypothetical protein
MGKGIHLGRSEMCFLVCEAVCILFYGLFTEYGELTSPSSTAADDAVINDHLQQKYPLF